MIKVLTTNGNAIDSGSAYQQNPLLIPEGNVESIARSLVASASDIQIDCIQEEDIDNLTPEQIRRLVGNARGVALSLLEDQIHAFRTALIEKINATNVDVQRINWTTERVDVDVLIS